jgi:hypothetical protein
VNIFGSEGIEKICQRKLDMRVDKEAKILLHGEHQMIWDRKFDRGVKKGGMILGY